MALRSLVLLFLPALMFAACGARTELEDPPPVPPGPVRQPICGNRVVEEGEQCDDGNSDSSDACVSCQLASCGDGFVRAGFELCDGTSSSCSSCAPITCGDGQLGGLEECDDGNKIDTDACTSRCLLARCGDGAVQAGEECDLGAANESRPALMITQGSIQKKVRPIEAAQSVASFYSYESASAHTGLEKASQSEVFFYTDTTTKQLSLIFIHGIDDAGQPKSAVRMQILHLPQGFVISQVDDLSGEFFGVSSTSAGGDWKFDNNTDGGAISGLPFPGRWDIDVVPGFSPGISSWVFVDGDRTTTALDLSKVLTLSAFDEAPGCRLDCNKPRCGDGQIDPGEECDDGNTANGDSCSPTCLRTLIPGK